jgi:hypothetical protein
VDRARRDLNMYDELARDLRRPVSRDSMFPTFLLAFFLLRPTTNGEASENVLWSSDTVSFCRSSDRQPLRFAKTNNQS